MNIKKIIGRELIDLALQLDMLTEVELNIIDIAFKRIEDAILMEHIAEIEKQVESAYKRGYDDGHVVGFQEGYTEKKKDKRIAELERKIPTDKPDPRLIESMAMRFDHSFVMMSAIEKEVLRRQMQQVWEEVVGLGFYNPSLSRGLGRHELELVEKAPSSDQQKALSNAFTDNNVARESKTRRIEKMNEQEWYRNDVTVRCIKAENKCEELLNRIAELERSKITIEDVIDGIEHLNNAYKHIAELEKKIADLESLTIVQENLPVPSLRRRIAELESQLLARNPEIIKVGSLEVASKDLKGRYDLYEALEACAELGDGWRLPTKDELNELYKNKDTIGGFVGDCYWSSTEYADHIAWFQRFDDGAMLFGFKCYIGHSVRPVRDSTI